MSKKFFAKYSAVEGEIKEGDLYLQNLVGIGFLNEIRTYTGGKLEARDKKVKLFLCSRDIKIGDRVKSFNYPEQNEGEVVDLRTSEKLVRAKDHSEIYHLADIQYPNDSSFVTAAISNFFKVIGEISQEAIWVKEGDEFDEYQIWCKNISFWGDHYVMIQPHAWKEPRPIDKGWSDEIIKLKGPCGHFH